MSTPEAIKIDCEAIKKHPAGKPVGIKVERRFTRSEAGPFVGIEWVLRRAEVKEADGRVVFEMDNVRVPSTWSQRATNILASKYCRKAGVPDTGHERDAEQVVGRIVEAIRQAGLGQGYFADQFAAKDFADELSWLLIHQAGAFNSPVWFNLGLAEAYGIRGQAAGCWEWSEEYGDVREVSDAYTRPQISACYIQSIKDDLMDIADAVKREIRVFKYGGGSGTNFSDLRADGEALASGGNGSGVMSFLDIFDKGAGGIKSGGTTRRAAKLVLLDDDHPDLLKFVEWKAREEDKARALVEAGFGTPGDFNSEAFRTVGGQNANNSVRVSDAFLNAVVNKVTWRTKWRVSGKVAWEKPAAEVFRKIAEAAWKCADPGLNFKDTTNAWHTCPNTGEIRGANPCQEYVFLDDTSCNLASLNLLKFLRQDGTFDVESFKHACRVFIIAQEIIVDHASYPTAEIARNSHRFRPLGLGYANIGALLMRKGLAYDSPAGCRLAASITSLMTAEAYHTSAELAGVKGPFFGYAKNKEPMDAVVLKHVNSCMYFQTTDLVEKAAIDRWDEGLDLGRKHGYRNAQVTLLAPTGTIGLLMDCDTTGIEPEFSLVKTKRLAGGGVDTIVNESVGAALDALCYSSRARDEIVEHFRRGGTASSAPKLMKEHHSVFACAVGEDAIDPMGHVRMMAAVQPFLSGAISKTVNMPSTATVEDVEAIYLAAWRAGLKAIAIYRDGSKAAQVLETQKPTPAVQPHGPPAVARVRLPKRRPGGFIQQIKVGGQKIYLHTGEYEDGRLGEIFVDMAKEGADLRSVMSCLAISVSIGLQHGVPLEAYVQALSHTRFAPSGAVDHDRVKFATSPVDAIFRILGLEYLGRDDLAHAPGPKDQEPTPEVASVAGDAPFCKVCGCQTRRTGNCHVCDNCGTSAGCS